MKTRSILFSAVLLLLYFLLTKYWQTTHSKLVADQGSWSQNNIKAQNFLYENTSTNYNCILGTSLSARLPASHLPENYYSLSFSSQGVSDGLEILNHVEHLPDTILIEVNFFSKIENREFLEKMLPNRFEIALKDKFPPLQEKNFPLGITANQLADMLYISELRKKYNRLMDRKTTKVNSEKSEVGEEKAKVFEKLKAQVKILLSDLSDQENLNSSSKRIIEKLKAFEQKNVKLVFFETPFHCELEKTPLFNFNREIVRSAFSPEKYLFIKDSCTGYNTTDGAHLDEKSAVSYTKYLLLKLRDSQ